MKIKTKLILSLSLIFALTITLAGLGIWQLRQMASDTGNILVANYNSLDYSRNMYKVLDEGGADFNKEKFRGFLNKQLNNLTEVGEQEFTIELKEDFEAYLLEPTPQKAVEIRGDLNSIMKLNMDAIKRKSLRAEATAEHSILWLSFASSFCLIIGFTLLVNLPGYIANPIHELTESIKQIAAKNYSQRVHNKGNDEFSTLAKSFNTMAEKLEEYSSSDLAKLMIEKKRIETLINNLSDPIIGLDDTNKVLFINEQALQITGLGNQDIIGQQAESLALKNDLLRTLLQKMLDENAISENLKIYANNKESHFEQLMVPINIIPTGESDKKRIGTFLILRNITAYKELDTAKTNFIATVSHEFKTPIASMKMSLQLLENEKTGSLNEEQLSLLEGLRDDTERLLRTTGELLNITQVETGKAQFMIEDFDIVPILNKALHSNEKLAERKEIRLVLSEPGALPNVMADRVKSEWILSNLLSNAIRYSYDNSEVGIKVSLTPTHVEIAVQDSGIGIAEEYHDKVFEKYFRVPGNEKEGTGLGLSISKEFINAMGGYLKMSSEIGTGSVFIAGFRIEA
ncbi:ATP-binding protein [Flavobacterium sp. AG291]|uniref:HAMP domain-containing sensor histidine kinase n=1 Tax=Flavobacterium sp. AG291 TaxID=2184000 RepID=UPI000E0A4821|nr:ATP-binding protein [Flavobacterium sp. AG291]RDI06705.1 PAS/PAC sensor signal transduction histidine kinase [Flavobacterium sp. AG291]